MLPRSHVVVHLPEVEKFAKWFTLVRTSMVTTNPRTPVVSTSQMANE